MLTIFTAQMPVRDYFADGLLTEASPCLRDSPLPSKDHNGTIFAVELLAGAACSSFLTCQEVDTSLGPTT